MNKLLILSILQLAMTGAVLYAVLTRSEAPPAVAAPAMPTAIPGNERPGSGAGADADLIRRIVRSELQAFAAEFPATTADPDTAAAASELPDPDAVIEAARNRLALYLSTGELSEAQLAQFQSSIAGLDAAQQQALLGELFRAINAGTIKVER